MMKKKKRIFEMQIVNLVDGLNTHQTRQWSLVLKIYKTNFIKKKFSLENSPPSTYDM